MTLSWSARLLGAVVLLISGVAFAQLAPDLPPQEPQLRIDPGTHIGRIQSIGVDAGCTMLATGSLDKTVRLWRLPEGKLMQTLRPPIGAGDEGKVYAVALAPDGSWVAADGQDRNQGYAWVSIFEATTGRVITRLGPLPYPVQHLAVSHDGRYLAAALGGGKGVRVWERVGDLLSWQVVGQDQDYGGKDTTSVAFDRMGRLYTTALDGRLRRYAAGYEHKPDAAVTPGGKEPFSVAVHPFDDRVAVSFLDTSAVEVYDSASLKRRFAMNTSAVHNGIFSLAWSADGTRLYAGGNFERNARFPVLVWDQSGNSSARELEGPLNSVQSLLPCGDDIAMGASLATFGLFAPDGSHRLWQTGVYADMRGKVFEHFPVSADGSRIRFGLGPASVEPILFDLAAERITDAPSKPEDLHATDEHGLPNISWQDSTGPKFDGKPILDPSEWAHSMAIAPNKKHFVLGTERWLRAYDSKGKLQWKSEIPGTVWGATIPRNGRLVIAAYSDGTIRWHRLSDGAELLALFVHAKDRRWVAWTPKGYYLASPGGEDLIGWHVNHGWNEAASFFSVDRFRDQFNRPDIVKLAPDLLDEEKAITEANRRAGLKRADESIRAALPPIIEIMRPENDATFRQREVTLEYRAYSPTDKHITDIDVRINGEGLGARAIIPTSPGEENRIKISLTLPPHDVTVTLVAHEGDRASQPASVRLRWDGVKPGEVVRPHFRGLFVGVSDYKLQHLKLGFAAKDATDLAAFFQAQEGKAYSKVESQLFADADRAAVLHGLEWLESGSEEGDVNLMFLAGHGVTDAKGLFYYLTADSDPGDLRATAVSRDEMLRTIKNRKGAMVVMLDTCNSGASVDASITMTSEVDMNRLANELGDKTLGVFLYASALGRQFSYEDNSWGNGAFTKAMIEGLSGKADSGNTGFIDTDELAVYVRRRVLTLTNKKQEPVRIKPDAAPEMQIAAMKF